MYLLPKRQSHALYLWLALFSFLLLVAFFFAETGVVQPLAEAGSAPVPRFSSPGGYYDQDVQLHISLPAAEPGHAIIFTRDGSLPTVVPNHNNGTIYTRPIHLEAAEPAVTVIRARAVLPGGEMGPVVSASYFMGVPATIPMISLIVGPDDLWHEQRGIYANPEQRGRQWERPVHITYVDTDRSSGFHAPAGLRIHGQFSRAYAKKSFRFYFRQEYGRSHLDYPVFSDSQVQSFKRLVLHASGQDTSQIPTNWTMMRNQIVAGLAMQTNTYATHSRPVIVFINGEPWGLYYLRERIDRFFLADEYGAEAIDIVDTPARRLENPEEIGPGFAYWDHLTAFVDSHDLAHPANYAYVQSQVDLANFIDYSILQIYSANFDWPFSNTKQFRTGTQGGRWR
jgi:hypothetical protein